MRTEIVQIIKGMIPAQRTALNRPRIAILYDQGDWAFYRKAERLKAYLNRYDYQASSYSAFRRISLSDLDAIFLIWWGAANQWLLEIPSHVHVFAGIWDHFTHQRHGLAQLRQVVFRSSVIFTASERLSSELEARAIVHRKTHLFPDCVDTDFFPFAPMMPRAAGKLIVGWAGNAHLGGNLKGVEIIQEACEKSGMELRIAEKHTSPIPFARMPEFYAGIDVLACASQSEGGPNTVLEAMATGRCVISTDVGIVGELLRRTGGGVIVERSVEAFIEGLQYLERNRRFLPEWGIRNRSEVERNWTWDVWLPRVEKVLRRFLK